MDHTNLPASVFNIVRDAIQAGFIDGITLDDFNAELSVLTPSESEDYVQVLSRQVRVCLGYADAAAKRLQKKDYSGFGRVF